METLLIKADKIIQYFHNASVVLGKEMGKILHHLLLQLDYDMKTIPNKIVKDDVEKLYSLIRAFDNNDYIRKRKIFQKMNQKINFYKKLEIPVL